MSVAIILGGGRGTRLSGISQPFAKTLLPVNGLPVIAYAALAVMPYVEEIIVVAHPSNASAVYEAALLGVDDPNKSLRLALQPEPLGMGDAIRIGLEGLDHDSPVVVMCGDNIVMESVNIGNVLSAVTSGNGGKPESSMSWTYRELEPDDARRFSVYRALSDSHGMLIEKPSEPPSKLCWCGPVAFASASEAGRRLLKLNPSARGEYEATDLMNTYLLNGESKHLPLIGDWYDIGTPESLAAARLSISNQPRS